MPLANYKLVVNVRDGKRDLWEQSYYGNFATDALARSSATSLLGAIAPLSLGVVATGVLHIKLLTNTAVPAATVDGQEGVVMTFEDSVGKATQVRIAAVNEAIMVAGTDIVNTGVGIVTDYTDEIISNGWTTERSDDIVAFRGGVEDWGKRRKKKG